MMRLTCFSGSMVLFVATLAAQETAAPSPSMERPELVPLGKLAVRQNTHQAALGRQLFFDPRLSGDATISCATCHDPQKAWCDGLPLSAGYPGSLYFRNTPTLLNVAQARYVYWDGRLPASDLPTVVRDHISEAHFFQADGRLLIERLRQVPEYDVWFNEAFGGEPTYGRILNALAAFLATLRSDNVPFDRFLEGDETALSDSAKRGVELFRGKAACIQCHHGPLLSDGGFHNLGVAVNRQVFQEPLRHITFRRFLRTLGVAEFRGIRRDVGLYAVTKQEQEIGRFRTPSLREVARTAPYMHNGSLATLDAVVAFYDRGGGDDQGKDPLLAKLNLNEQERADLLALLQSLSGDDRGIEVPEVPPYQVRKFAGGQATDRQTPSDADDVPRQTAPAGTAFPPLAAIAQMPPVPADNPVTPAKIQLGRLLFFDDRLSGDGGTSCATCHEPYIGWGDGNAISMGYEGTEHWRNSQTTVNTGYLSKLFWAGESPSLEAQAASAIEGNVAGNGDPVMIEERLAQIPEYVRLFQEAFGVDHPHYPLVLKAIATFERVAMNSTDSPFDRYMRGDKKAMSEPALRGMKLFEGKAKCIRCHHGPLLTDESFHAIGVPRNPLFDRVALYQITLRYQFFIRGVPERVYRAADRDLGLYYTTKRKSDAGKFRTPPLRYLTYTAPYMHNGVFEQLEDVINFYDEGGGESEFKSELLEPLGLSDAEKADLLAFLQSLTGSEIGMSPPDLPAYEMVDGF